MNNVDAFTSVLAQLPFDRDFWTSAERARRAAELMDAAAMDQVQRNRAAKVRPQVVYRCARRCGLLTVWKYPKGLLIWHPALRVSARRFEGERFPLGIPVMTAGARRPEFGKVWDDPMTGALVIPSRAYLWNGAPHVFVACEHIYGSLSGEKFAPILAGDVAAALKRGSPTKVTVRVAQADSDGHG